MRDIPENLYECVEFIYNYCPEDVFGYDEETSCENHNGQCDACWRIALHKNLGE